MQTAMGNLVHLMNHNEKCETKPRLLLDCGAQRSSYISEELVKKMNLKPANKNLLIVYTFGTTKVVLVTGRTCHVLTMVLLLT